MNIFRLSMKRNYIKPIDEQVFDYISAWNGETGLHELVNYADCVEMFYQMGRFLEDYTTLGLEDDTDHIYGILIYSDNMGDFIKGFVANGGKVIKVD